MKKIFLGLSGELLTGCLTPLFGFAKSQPSLYSRNKPLVWLVGSTIILLLATVLVLVINNLQRRKTEEALRESEKRFRDLANLLPQPVFECAGDGRITFANQFAFQEFKYSNEDLSQGLNIFSMVVESELARENMLKMIAGEPTGNLYTAVRKDGTFFPMAIYSSIIFKEKKPAGLRGVILNLTDIKGAGEILRRSQERWEFALEGSGDGVWDWNLETNETFFSRRWKEMLGYSEKEIGNHFDEWKNRVHPDDSGRVMEEIQKHLEKKTAVYVSEYRLRCQDGSYKWILDRGKVISLLPDGRPLRMIGIHTDISERKKTEEELRASEERFRTLIQNASDIITIHDSEGKILYESPSAARILGYKPGLMLGKSPFDLVHPDDLAFISSEFAKVATSKQPGKPNQYRLRRADGTWIWLESISVNLLDQPGIRGIVTTSRDINEHKDAESLQSALFQIAETASSAKDMKELYRSIHRIVGELMDTRNFYIALYDKKNQLISFPYFIDQFDPPQKTRGLRNGLTEYVLRTGQPLLADGSVFRDLEQKKEIELIGTDSVDWVGVPLKTADQETIGVMVTQSYDPSVRHNEKDKDILVFVSHQIAAAIQRKQAEEDLRQTEEQFQQLQKIETIGTLVGSIAHDYNNILTSIMGNAQLLEYKIGSKPTPLSKHVQAIISASESAAGMVQQLLTFSRRDEPYLEILSLSSLISDWNEILRRAVEEHIQLSTRLAPDVYPVKVDQGKIKQILMNLIINARDAMPEGGDILIETFNVDLRESQIIQNVLVKAGTYVCLAVKDSGHGISSDYVGKIFEPFFTTKGKGKGTGLGLSTVKRIVEQLNGYITVESRPSLGTCFTILIPRYQETTAAEAGEKKIKGKIPTGKGQVILVVEDEESVRTIMLEMLQTLQYDAIGAATAKQALNLLNKKKIALVISDIKMPEMSGSDLLKIVQTSHAHLSDKVIAMTAYSEDGMGDLQRQGFREVLKKPVDMRLLSAALERIFTPSEKS